MNPMRRPLGAELTASQGAPASSLVALAAAISLAVSYALTAYLLTPFALPAAVGTVMIVGAGLWRLEFGLAVLIALTPFAENASISTPGSAPLRIVLVFWTLALIVVHVGRALARGQRLHLPPLTTPAVLFLVAALISVPAGNDASAALAKWLLLVGSVLTFLLIASFITDWRRLKVVLAGVVLAGLGVCGYALYQYLTGQPGGQSELGGTGFTTASGKLETRASSVFPHPNQLAGFAILLIPVAVSLWRIANNHRLIRVAGLALLPLSIAAVVVSFSRGGLIALVALPLIYLRKVSTWPAVIVVALGIAFFAPPSWESRVTDPGTTAAGAIAQRVDLWDAALAAFGNAPVIGYGLDNFSTAYVATERPGRDFLGTGDVIALPPTAHNLYMNTLAEQGLIGISALLLLTSAIAAVGHQLRRSLDPRTRAYGLALLGVGLALLASNIFDVTFTDAKTSTLAWCLFGVGSALLAREREFSVQRATSPADNMRGNSDRGTPVVLHRTSGAVG
jgi:O-antigen ligase